MLVWQDDPHILKNVITAILFSVAVIQLSNFKSVSLLPWGSVLLYSLHQYNALADHKLISPV